MEHSARLEQLQAELRAASLPPGSPPPAPMEVPASLRWDDDELNETQPPPPAYYPGGDDSGDEEEHLDELIDMEQQLQREAEMALGPEMDPAFDPALLEQAQPASVAAPAKEPAKDEPSSSAGWPKASGETNRHKLTCDAVPLGHGMLGTALRRRLDFEDATADGPPAARRRLDGADAVASKGVSSSTAGVLARPGMFKADAKAAAEGESFAANHAAKLTARVSG